MRAENLTSISFVSNNIGSDGCLALIKANWIKVSIIRFGNHLNLGINQIGDKGCNHLMRSNWNLA